MKRVLSALSVSLAAAPFILATAPAQAAVTFDYAAVSAHTNTSVGGQTGVGDGFDQAFSGSIDPSFNISAVASSSKKTAVKKPKPATVTLGTANASSDVNAIFNAPSSGAVNFGQTDTVTATAAGAIPALASSQGEFYYNFTVDQKSNYLFTYDFLSTGINGDATAPSQYYQLYSYNTSSLLGSAVFTTGNVGSFANVLTAGSYQLYVGNYYFGSPTTAGLKSASASPVTTTLNADYTFDITAAPVPEPANWAMMITGFGLVGSTMRRRKVQTALA